MARVRVKTEQFEFSHGKRPSGRGLWAFEFEGTAGYQNRNGLYSEVLKEAIKTARALGSSTVTVLP